MIRAGFKIESAWFYLFSATANEFSRRVIYYK
jgi:hypothetical protein